MMLQHLNIEPAVPFVAGLGVKCSCCFPEWSVSVGKVSCSGICFAVTLQGVGCPHPLAEIRQRSALLVLGEGS